jgi:hypothetical protein
MPRAKWFPFDIDDFSLGWNNTGKPTTLDKRSFTDVKNFNITRHKGLEKRGGIEPLYPVTSGSAKEVKTLYEYKAPNGENYVLTAVDTKVRAYYELQWNDLKTGLTADKNYSFVTHLGLCYGVNGVDSNFKLYNDTAYSVGIAPPINQPTVAAASTGTDVITTTYPTGNRDYIGELRSGAGRTMIAQSFKMALDFNLAKVTLKVRKVGSPTGNMWVEIHSSTVGTSASKNASTNIVTVSSASANVDVSAFTTSFASQDFTFSTAEPAAEANTTYYIVIYSSHTVSTTNFVEVGFDNADAGYTDGKYWELNGSQVWTEYETVDLVFEVYGTAQTAAKWESFGAENTTFTTALKQTGVGGVFYGLAQSFTVQVACDVLEVKIPLQAIGPEWLGETVWVEIHDLTTGLSFTKDTSTNINGEASDSLDIDSELNSSSPTFVTFEFSGTAPQLATSTLYYMVLMTDHAASATQYIRWTRDKSGYPTVGSVTFTGSGLDDCISGGKYTGTGDIDYRVQIDGTSPDTFKYSINGGSTWYSLTQSVMVSPVTLLYGATVTFGATLGHTIGDYWDFTAIGSSAYTISSAGLFTAANNDFSFELWGGPTASAVSEQYALTNIVNYVDHRAHVSQSILAQSFKTTTTADCTKVTMYASRVGTLTGKKLYLEIHSAQDGTSASTDTSTRQLGSVSGYVDAAALSAFPTYDTITFTFTGTDPPLVKDTTYYLVLYGDATVSTSNYVKIQQDRLDTGYSDGSRWDINGTQAWTEVPSVDLLFNVYQAAGGLAASYKYVYTYKRTDFQEFEGNPSEPSVVVSPSTQKVNVSVVASTDSQVDTITVYRTLDYAAGAADSTLFYKAVELANSTATWSDDLADGDLTTLVDFDNTVPPKAHYLTLHKDRVFYCNCPDEEDGGSLVRWGKLGYGDASPSRNYQYFDRRDGEDITGVASLADYLLIFKRNKIGVLAGDLAIENGAELWYLSEGTGAISAWGILPFEDQVVFLSEEGWKATDGKSIYPLSAKINGLIEDGYITTNERNNYSAVYYPEKEQFQYLCNHSTNNPQVYVGHLLAPLMLASQGILGVSEQSLGNLMAWTYHEYDFHTLTCLGTYTNDTGITKVIAGDDNGFVYLLDSGHDDDGSNISATLKTDWLTFGARAFTKTIRRGYLTYATDGTVALDLVADLDFTATNETTSFTGGSVDLDNAINESFDLTGTGEVFRFTLTESSTQSLDILGLSIMYRVDGTR